MIVIALMMLLATTGYVASLSIIRWQSLLNDTNLITSQIALAQMHAYSQRDGQSHGVKILSNEVVRFTGDSYALRDQELDVVLPRAGSISLTGDTEIVFTEGGLAPIQPFIIILEMGIRTHEISVSSYGILDTTTGISES